MPDHVSDPAAALADRLRHLAETEPALRLYVRDHAPGDELLREGVPNDSLYALLQGEIALFKKTAGPEPIRVSTHGPGDLLGVHSISTGRPAFTTARVLTPLRCLRLDTVALADLPASHPEFHQLLQELITANLAGRYRSAVRLQLHLAEANAELTETRNQLVHQEKMAVLGQLVAGLAHELNNPAAALARQRDHLADTLVGLFGCALPAGWLDYWQAGETAPPAASDPAARARLEKLDTQRPALPRPLQRRLAALPEPLAAALLPPRDAAELAPDAATRLAVFETAHLLHAQQAAAAQISHLVASLKNYARPGSAGPERVNLRANLENTLLILGSSLEHTDVSTALEPDLEVHARGGDLSQVWTNLVRNAAEAMGPGGKLEISARRLSPAEVEVCIIDHGPGIPPALRDRVFELNFTTKTGRENFGLGLGLSITRTLVAQHGGHLAVRDTPGGGATFAVRLPLL